MRCITPMTIMAVPLTALLVLARPCPAGEAAGQTARVASAIEAEGSCAIAGMDEEQARMIALRRARAGAVMQALGGKPGADARVSDERLQVEFLEAYSKGLIVKEKVWELTPTTYQKDESTPPVPEYTVKIMADVLIPERAVAPLGLDVRMNEKIFKSGEVPEVVVDVGREARIGVFSISPQDRVVMVFPNRDSKDNEILDGMSYIFPSGDTSIDMRAEAMPGHRRDAGAIFVIVMDREQGRDFSSVFNPLEQMGLPEFFGKYAGISEYCEHAVLPYEVLGN